VRLISLLALALLSSAALADTPTPGPSLKSCNKQADAKGLTGKDRATFIKDCLAGKTP